MHDSMHAAGRPDEIRLAPIIDHTLLRADATPSQIEHLCNEAVEYGFAAVCVHPRHAERAVTVLRNYPTAVASVVGFPHGMTLGSTKGQEARSLIEVGVGELDMVIPVGLLKAGDRNAVADDIGIVVHAARTRPQLPALVKVIIEAGLLTDAEKVLACELARDAGADYVKTSTGFAATGATEADVALMRRTVGATLGVKAAGGIRTREQALAMVRAGATRIGTSSGPNIVREELL